MIKVIYHANCSDGFCGAFLFWQKYPDAEFIPFHYSQGLDLGKFNKEDEVYIVDFSFNQPTLLELAGIVKSIVVLDHHKTAKADLEQGPWPDNVQVFFDMERSGAMMAWGYFNGSVAPDLTIEVPEIVKYVQDRDLWMFELPYSREINAYLQALPFDFNTWRIAFENFEANKKDMISMGQAILMKLDQQVDAAVKHANLVKFRLPRGKFHRVYAVNSTVNFSEVAGKLAEKSDFGVAWFMRSDGKYQYSLRSRNNFDVSSVAKQFGGGGHRNAAGFESDELVFNPTFDPTHLIGKTIKVPLNICETGYIYIYGYDPQGVNPLAHLKGCSVPHFEVYECTEDGDKVNETKFNIPEDEMEGFLCQVE